jgi:hypothetical protein
VYPDELVRHHEVRHEHGLRHLSDGIRQASCSDYEERRSSRATRHGTNKVSAGESNELVSYIAKLKLQERACASLRASATLMAFLTPIKDNKGIRNDRM